MGVLQIATLRLRNKKFVVCLLDLLFIFVMLRYVNNFPLFMRKHTVSLELHIENVSVDTAEICSMISVIVDIDEKK